jgi:DNA repair photolyase
MKPELNPDGVSIKGCTLIYAPKGQAGEYAPLACNPYRGCSHGCSYCYVPAAIHLSREQFDAAAIPRENFIEKLEREAYKYYLAGSAEQVFLSFTTDVFNPSDTSLTRPTIETLKRYGLGFCTLTKGGYRALPFLDLFRPDRDCFASTLTTLDPAVSVQWERNAALPAERLDTLKRFHDAGIYTWVSLEPVIDTETAKQIIRETAEFVDLYKVGRINYHRLTRLTDWERFTHDITALLADLGKAHYVKHDLQPYLPAGYHNPLRRPQFHASTGASTDTWALTA